MARVVITEFMDESAVARLRAAHDVLYDPTLVDDPARMLAEAPGADAWVVRNRTPVRGELLRALGRCRVIGRLGVGLDNVDVAACEARGLPVIPATGANARSVGEYVITTAMMLLRGAYGASAELAAGAWPRARLSGGRELSGRTLGLVGFGSIGQTVAALARALGMEVIAFDAMRDEDDPIYARMGVRWTAFGQLIAASDVLSLHVPLDPGTRGLIDAFRLGQMKPDAILINTSRGGVVDEQAVAAALRAGTLGGAALDVFEQEPPGASAHFVDCPNLLLTPHVAGLSQDSNHRVSAMIAERVLEALAARGAA